MKTQTISYRYKLFYKANPMWGNYIILSKAIRGMKYGKMKIFDAFNKYVPKKDFAIDEKDMLLENLVKVSKDEKPAELPILLATNEN